MKVERKRRASEGLKGVGKGIRVSSSGSISWKSAAVRRKHPDWMGLLCPKGKTSVRKEERGRRWEEKVE